MSITIREHYHAVVIAISGKFLGSLHGDEFKQKIDELKEEGHVHVVVDLGKTEFMDSSGIGTLISGLTSIRNAGGDMRLANLQERIQGLFLMMRLLGSAFEHYPSVDEALQSFEERPEPKEAKETKTS